MTNDIPTNQPVFAKFWIRAAAYFSDSFVLFILTFPITYWNIVHVKSFILYLLITAIGIVYKPYLESHYGATVGKMIFKLKVTDLQFNQIDLKQSFLRSFILIFPMMLYIPIYYLGFNNPELMELDSFMEFGIQLAATYPFLPEVITNLIMATFIAEIIFILTDNNNKARALHDRIGKTYVIKVKK